MKRNFAALYLIVLHLVVATALIKTDLIDRAGFRLGLLTPAEAPIISTMREVHRQMDASVPDGATIFLGDSITMALATAAVAPLPVNYGIGYQRSDQLVDSMKSYESLHRAGAVVVMIGTNDILQGAQGGIGGRFSQIISSVPAGVPVVLSSPPPTTKGDAQSVMVEARTACGEDPRCTFVDATVIGKEGLLPDGVHLNPSGYAQLIAMLRVALGNG